MTPDERWLPVVGYEGRYEVSSLGRVKSLPRARTRGGLLNPWQGRYLKVALGGKTKSIHRIVAEAFHGAPKDGQVVRHLDGDNHNNAASNLHWGTQAENEADKIRHGTNAQLAKTHCPQGHPYAGPNLIVRKRARACRTCETRRLHARGEAS